MKISIDRMAIWIAMCIACSVPVSANLLTNGGFDDYTDGGSGVAGAPQDPDDLDNLTPTSWNVFGTNDSNKLRIKNAITAQAGSFYLGLFQNANPSSSLGIYQTLATTPGIPYRLTFHTRRNGSGTARLEADIFSGQSITDGTGDGDLANPEIFTDSTASWSQHVVDFTASTTAATVRIMEPADINSISKGPLLDSVSVTPGPPIISAFVADDHYITSNSAVNLSWTVNGATNLHLSPGPGDVTTQTTNGIGRIVVRPTTNTIYTLRVIDAKATNTQTVAVTVGPPRPNIIFFLVDDMGVHDTSVSFILDRQSGNLETNQYQNFYVTPNMETLAAQGMRFTQAYAQPSCSPTRASLICGYNAPRHGLVAVCTPLPHGEPGSFDITNRRTPDNWARQGLSTNYPTLPRLLRDIGYRTIHCGKGHFARPNKPGADPRDYGFDINIAGKHHGQPGSYLGTANYSGRGWMAPGLEDHYGSSTFLTKALTIELNKRIAEAANDGVPFYAYMSHYAVHTPFTADPDATGDYSAGVNARHQKFAKMIEGVDISLGAILSNLAALGIAENTLIIFMGDNGSDSPALSANHIPSGIFNYPMRGKKGTRWEGGTRVPLLASWAATNSVNPFQVAFPIASNSRTDDLVSCIDIMPTLLTVAGANLPETLDGYNLSPYLSGQPDFTRPQQLLCYHAMDHNNDYFAWWRDEDWKLIYTFEPERYELYNLPEDPSESNDRAATEPHRVMAMARAMARAFDEGWGELGPLWPAINPTPYVRYPTRPLGNADALTMPELPALNLDGNSNL